MDSWPDLKDRAGVHHPPRDPRTGVVWACGRSATQPGEWIRAGLREAGEQVTDAKAQMRSAVCADEGTRCLLRELQSLIK